MITINEQGNCREIINDENPRAYLREWKCAECGEWLDEQDTVWINPENGIATMEGNPYHTFCAPDEI